MSTERVTAEEEIKTITKLLDDFRAWKPDGFSINNYEVARSILEKMNNPKYAPLFNEEIEKLKEEMEYQKEGINWHLFC